ncbi:MAG TPA: antibiotic biosynthesis monooxygenase family protein [Terriglobales bacterium]|nr:antibiotic biosynthesis monooxygenase family protein [Terriglobales bacterium]
MIYVLWQFRAKPEKVEQFERDYGPEGIWAQLFRRSPHYERTVLLRDPAQPAGYIVIDIWQDEASYQAFKKEFHEEYQRIDRECEALTLEETPLGIFDTVLGPLLSAISGAGPKK